MICTSKIHRKTPKVTPEAIQILQHVARRVQSRASVAAEPLKSQKHISGTSKGVPKGVQKRTQNGPWAQKWNSKKTKSEIVLRLQRERNLEC